MPEGPEIRRAADRLGAVVLGLPLSNAWFWFPALKRHAFMLKGRTIEAITPHGKALLTRFDNPAGHTSSAVKSASVGCTSASSVNAEAFPMTV